MGRVVVLGPRFINSNTYAIGSKFFCCDLRGIANHVTRDRAQPRARIAIVAGCDGQLRVQ
jgi:hypothetical protein